MNDGSEDDLFSYAIKAMLKSKFPKITVSTEGVIKMIDLCTHEFVKICLRSLDETCKKHGTQIQSTDIIECLKYIELEKYADGLKDVAQILVRKDSSVFNTEPPSELTQQEKVDIQTRARNEALSKLNIDEEDRTD